MKTKFLYPAFFFVILIIFVAAGCSKNEIDKSVILPLKIGNYWVYKVTNTIDGKVETDTLKVARDTLIKGEKWFIVNHTSEHSFVLILQNKSDGLHMVDYYNTPHIFLKYKAIPGEVFTPRKEKDSVKVISINEKVVVPAGTFECYIYGSPQTDINTKEDHFCMAPGIGCIKTMVWTILYELVNYKID